MLYDFKLAPIFIVNNETNALLKKTIKHIFEKLTGPLEVIYPSKSASAV